VNDSDINKHVKDELEKLEKIKFIEDDLINGKADALAHSAYILIKGERLAPTP
jgi:hypothetical protein